MDVDYLKQAIGEPLAAALTTLVLYQPKDPVDFVGQYLVRHANYITATTHKGESMRILQASNAKLIDDSERVKATAAVDAAVERHRRQAEESTIASLLATTELTTIQDTAIACVKAGTSASGVYVGKVIQSLDGTEIIKYIAADADNRFMIGETLRGSIGNDDLDNTDPEELRREGVTFRLWEATAAAEGDSSEGDSEEAAEKTPSYPEFLHIENVLREPAIKFFGVPRMGAYLALPIAYHSALHDQGIVEAPAAAALEGGPEAARAEQPAESPSDEAGGEGIVVAEMTNSSATVEKRATFVPATIMMRAVMGIDCMGQARSFTLAQIDAGLVWAKHLSRAMEVAESKLWDQERLKMEAVIQESAALRSEILTNLRSQVASMETAYEDQESGPDRTLQQALMTFGFTRDTLLTCKDHMLHIYALRLKPLLPHLSQLLAAAVQLLLGKNTDSLTLWEDLRPHLSHAFWQRVEAFSPTLHSDKLQSRDDLVELIAIMEGIPEDEAEASSVGAWVLLKYIKAACGLIEAIWDKRDSEPVAEDGDEGQED